MSNISVQSTREEPQLIAVHRGQSRADDTVQDMRAVGERRRILRIMLLLWLMASGSQGAHFLA